VYIKRVIVSYFIDVSLCVNVV